MCDGKFPALLSGGDAIALELKYHLSCLTALYHRERAHLARETKKFTTQPRKKNIIVSSEHVTYVIWKSNSCDEPTPLKLAGLVKLYKEMFEQLVSEIQSWF